MPLAPPPQRRVVSSSCSIFANGLPRRTTTPGTPPSRTMRLEPRPSAITGTSRVELAAGNATRSSSSAGSNSHSALPPLLNQTSGASGALGVSSPADLAAWSRSRSFARPRVADAVGERGGPFGDVAGAHADDHVAVGGEVAQLAAQLVEVVDGRAPCGGRARAGLRLARRNRRPRSALRRRIDRRHEHHVGIVEGVLELVHQRCSRV